MVSRRYSRWLILKIKTDMTGSSEDAIFTVRGWAKRFILLKYKGKHGRYDERNCQTAELSAHYLSASFNRLLGSKPGECANAKKRLLLLLYSLNHHWSTGRLSFTIDWHIAQGGRGEKENICACVYLCVCVCARVRRWLSVVVWGVRTWCSSSTQQWSVMSPLTIIQQTANNSIDH